MMNDKKILIWLGLTRWSRYRFSDENSDFLIEKHEVRGPWATLRIDIISGRTSLHSANLP